MHLYFITRGIKHEVDQLVNDLQAQFYQLEARNKKTGDKEIDLVQGGLRPVQLWEYVFPKTAMSIVLNSLGLPRTFPKGHPYNKFKPIATAMRKMLGAKEIPKPKDVIARPLRKKHVGIHGIGIKEDIDREIDDRRYEFL